jgi:hypothetical protein
MDDDCLDSKQVIHEATIGAAACSNYAAAAAAPNTTMFPGVIRVGGNDDVHFDDKHSLSLMVSDRNIVAPTVTMVEAEKVDLVYGLAEAVKGGQQGGDKQEVAGC